MSILNNIKDKAKALINISEPYVTRQTTVYYASKNKIMVAGLLLDSVVSSTINSDVLTTQEQGIDYYYMAYYQTLEQRTLSVVVLPTAYCLNPLRLLALKQQESRGWFNISVHENDKIVNVYRGFILNLPEIEMQQEGSDRTITFAIKSMFSGVSILDQSTKTENDSYSKYGNRPDRYGAVSTINEDDGGIKTTLLGDSVGERLEDFNGDYIDDSEPLNNNTEIN